MQSESTGTAPNPADFKPEPERLDLSSVKVGMSCGMLLILIACLIGYWNCFKLGFLFDDFLHIENAARVAAGQWNAFPQGFFFGDSVTPQFESFSPVSAISFLLQYEIFRSHGLGYHLINVILYFCCCAFVSLITLELTGLKGNRLGAAPAIWAGLLFAIYPLHPEAVAWVTGRVDIFCALFYLASLFFYLRFRLLKEGAYLNYSVLAFTAALLSNETAMTLPVVLSLGECLIWNGGTHLKEGAPATHSSWIEESPAERVKFLSPFWLLLTVFAGLRFFILSRIAGPEGPGAALGVLTANSTWDPSTLSQFVLPVNELAKCPTFIPLLMSAVYLLVLALLAIRFTLQSPNAGTLIFLTGWTTVALLSVVPCAMLNTITAHHAGLSYLLPSAPLCILIALAALPAVDAATKKQASILSVAGAIVLLAAFVTWCEVLHVNMRVWRAASQLPPQTCEPMIERRRLPGRLPCPASEAPRVRSLFGAA